MVSLGIFKEDILRLAPKLNLTLKISGLQIWARDVAQLEIRFDPALQIMTNEEFHSRQRVFVRLPADLHLGQRGDPMERITLSSSAPDLKVIIAYGIRRPAT
ncbi:hypothetical protein TWF106_008944 [Orbilia oligospora]|uniref:Uncharacterized protein n=1 Tax=Orbilia oligospora TaxID=2813651 RepID=A0A7C8QIP0_ORBOL|nr:hypothetical protein TWF106_008944 [Orbilia oligospora]